MAWNRYVIGFHGCDRVAAEKVISGREVLKGSKNEYDWLGHGIYFWEDSFHRAWKWAESGAKRDKSKVGTPYVIGAVIDLGFCLDLIDTDSISLVKETYELMKGIYKKHRFPIPVNKGPNLKQRNLDCFIINMLHELREDAGEKAFDTVRGFFIEGNPIYDSAGFRELDHIQICVRNTDNIVGYFHPKRRSQLD